MFFKKYFSKICFRKKCFFRRKKRKNILRKKCFSKNDGHDSSLTIMTLDHRGDRTSCLSFIMTIDHDTGRSPWRSNITMIDRQDERLSSLSITMMVDHHDVRKIFAHPTFWRPHIVQFSSIRPRIFRPTENFLPVAKFFNRLISLHLQETGKGEKKTSDFFPSVCR